MAKGDVTYLLTDFCANRTGATTVEFRGNVTKYVEDEDGAQQSIGSWTGRLSYPKAGFGARTFASVRADLIAEIKAKNAALSGKAVT